MDVWERREEGEIGAERRRDTINARLIGSAFRPRGIRNNNKWAKVRRGGSLILSAVPPAENVRFRIATVKTKQDPTSRSPASPLSG